jgi:hypothetical protein
LLHSNDVTDVEDSEARALMMAEAFVALSQVTDFTE